LERALKECSLLRVWIVESAEPPSRLPERGELLGMFGALGGD
jgi:hypothetical protein